MQYPIGREENLKGVIDLITKRAYYFDGDNGETVRIEEAPSELADKIEEARNLMLDKVAEYDDAVMEKYLEGEELSEEELHRCVKNGTLSLGLTPVYMGSAFKNKGVQPLLEAISRYLPSPLTCSPPTVLDDTAGQENPPLPRPGRGLGGHGL